MRDRKAKEKEAYTENRRVWGGETWSLGPEADSRGRGAGPVTAGPATGP